MAAIKKNPSDKQSAKLTVHLTASEKATARRRAKRLGVSLSELARASIRDAASKKAA